MASNPTGQIVETTRIEGRVFQIEKLDPPVRRGAGLRYYRLWEDGRPSFGGAWHYTLESAQRRITYVVEGSVISQRDRLLNYVNVLEREIAKLKGVEV